MCPSDFVSDKDGYKLRFSYEIKCHPGCHTDQISDGKCHQQCNRAECGFDGGDCGKHEVDLTNSKRPIYEARQVSIIRFKVEH